jgi:hypothetical protein
MPIDRKEALVIPHKFSCVGSSWIRVESAYRDGPIYVGFKEVEAK